MIHKIIEPRGWTGGAGDGLTLFEVLDPYNLRHGAMDKVAGSGIHPRIQKYIDDKILNIDPRDDRYVYVLCSNMGAGETWGSNINADRFLRHVLAYEGRDWGVQTFLDAGIYKHHVNKDKKKSYGDITFVLFAPAPTYLDRVESIVRLDRERAARVGAEDVIQAVDRGEFPAWSMGARVAEDVCSFCGNRAKTRSQYCIHMRKYPNMIITAEFFGRRGFDNLQTNQLGLRICVDNPKPKFFDFSRVWIGAAPEAKTLRKVAEVGRAEFISSADLAEAIIKGAADKSATITKRVEGTESDLIGKSMKIFSKREEELPTDVLNDLGDAGLKGALSTTSSMGIVLKPKEFQRVVLRSRGEGGVADLLDNLGAVFPRTDRITSCHSELAGTHFVQALAHMLLNFVQKRSVYGPAIKARIIRVNVTGNGPKEPTEHDTEPLKKISSLYNGYRLGLLEKVSSSGKEYVLQHPALLRALYAEALGDMSSGLTKQAEDLVNLPTVAYILHADGADIPKLLQKSPDAVAPFLRRAAQAIL